MRRETYDMEFLTPCFCAGANQGVPELRATSIRGQLRWWFRALGGTREEEIYVFGGSNAGKDKMPASSKVIVRVEMISECNEWQKPDFNVNEDQSYVWYYAKVSGLDTDATKEEKNKGGPRWLNDAYFGPGSKWRLFVCYRTSLGESEEKFRDALKCFLALGAIGLRITRGLGGFYCKQQAFNDDIRSLLLANGFAIEERVLGGQDFYNYVGSLVKGTRAKFGWKNTDTCQTPSPFGTSNPRQMSAIYFRKVKKSDGPSLIVFSPPYTRILEEQSRGEIVVGKPSQIVLNPSRSRR
jgi:CRISPR type III-B/RAMP module RAMP protein Cmr1